MRRMGHMTRMQWSVARDHRALTGENRKWLGCYADGLEAVRIRIVASPKMMNVFMVWIISRMVELVKRYATNILSIVVEIATFLVTTFRFVVHGSAFQSALPLTRANAMSQ